jgi:hypothetical protein
LVDSILASERTARAYETETKTTRKHQLVIGTAASVTIKSVVPFLRQTPDFPKKCLEHYNNTRCAYYTAYFLHVLLSLDDLQKLPDKTAALPTKLKPLLDRNAFCTFFEELLKRTPVTQPDEIANLDPHTIHKRVTAFFAADNRPLVLSVPTFQLCENDPSFTAQYTTTTENWGLPAIKDDLIRIREFRDGSRSILPIVLSDQTQVDVAPTHWNPCLMLRGGKSDRLIAITGDSYYDTPNRELIEKLAMYLLQK